MAGKQHFASLAGGAALLAALSAASALYGAARITPCDSTELTASIGDSVPAKGPGLDRMTIVLVGDAGFNPSDAEVDAKGVHKGRAVTAFTDMTSAHRQGRRRRPRLRQSRDGGHRPQRPYASEEGQATRMLRSISGATRPPLRPLSISASICSRSPTTTPSTTARKASRRRSITWQSPTPSAPLPMPKSAAISTRRSSPLVSTSTARASPLTRSASSAATPRNFVPPTRAPARRHTASVPTSKRS